MKRISELHFAALSDMPTPLKTCLTALAWMLVMCPLSIGMAQSVDVPPATGVDDLAAAATWTLPGREEFDTEFSQWLNDAGATAETIDLVKASYLGNLNGKPASDLIDAVIDAIVIARPEVNEVRVALRDQRSGTAAPDFSSLIDNPDEDEFFRSHLRLYFGRWLAQNELYDEALGHLEKIELERTLDPMTLLFYRGLMEHQLLRKEACLKTINQLLERSEALPRRYEVLSRLMLADMQPLEPDSLDEISRMMGDIRRRTGLNRSGKLVLGQEKQVIEKLDKLIEKLESQQQPQAAAGAINPSDPMQDSIQAAGKGSGQVTSKPLKDGGSWGDLPPAQRAAALAEMAKDMPPHYREVIEEYFRKLAKENER